MKHCWIGKDEFMEKRYGQYSEEHSKAMWEEGAICMLEDGHKGKHEWTPNKNITIRFKKKGYKR